MATVDTKVDDLVIWQGSEEQIQDAIEQGLIDDHSIAVATDVEYAKNSDIGNGKLSITVGENEPIEFSANQKTDVSVTIPVLSQVQSDWNQLNRDATDYIKNKPEVATITVKRFAE